MALLFITHDLGLVAEIADRVAVMYAGQVVETGPVDQVLEAPAHPYTRALLSAVPSTAPGAKRTRTILKGDVPSPINPPTGCHFHTRCPYAVARCREEVPVLREVAQGHLVSCHLHDAGVKFPLAA